MNKKLKISAPRIATWILKKVLPFSDSQYLIGDFEEEYLELREEKGPIFAKFWYWMQVLKTTPDFIKNNIYGNTTMFKNYLKVTIRNFTKNKTYSLINIGGLAVGMACCLLILAYVSNELSYDNFHDNKGNIYRLNADGRFGPNDISVATSVPPAANALINDFPEVINAVRLVSEGARVVSYKANKYRETNVLFTDNSIFEIFSFPLINGDPKTALQTARTVVLTETTAKKYFDNEDPLGKVLTMSDGFTYSVTGIAADVPANSHFTFDILVSMQTQYQMPNPARMERWIGYRFHTYVLLQDGFDYRELQEKMPDFVERHAGDMMRSIGGEIHYSFQSLTDIYLRTNRDFSLGVQGNIFFIYVFSAIAVLILVIACINFMNLATARSANRAKEVGMRKVLGADRKRLVNQFLSESVVFCFMSLLIALMLVQVALPAFSSLAGKTLTIEYTNSVWLMPTLLAVTMTIGILSGSYPAFFLASFKPTGIIRGTNKFTNKNTLRSVLVVVQFTISISLIIGTSIIYNQLSYMKNKAPGFDKDHIVSVPFGTASIKDSEIENIKSELKIHTGVRSVSAASNAPGMSISWDIVYPEGSANNQKETAEMLFVDHDFLPTLGIELSDGRNFSPEFGTDREGAVLINETAVKKFGWVDPVDKVIKTWYDPKDFSKLRGKKVVGVIKDVHLNSLHTAIKPLYIAYGRDRFYEGYNMFILKISSENIPDTIEFIKNKWSTIAPGKEFRYFFLDALFNSQYRADERMTRTFAYFAGFAIFIACLGLFAMASFTAERRTREIGIRKVLGDTVSGIIIKLNKDLLKLVAIATLFSWPLAYYTLHKWLQTFPYKTDISLFLFLAATISVFTIALLTVMFQAAKAAMTNPINALRNE